mgnify:CR=1 FL=1
MHAKDLATIIKLMIINKTKKSFNVATDENYTVKQISEIALEACDAKDLQINFDTSKPNGQNRKDIDIKIEEKDLRIDVFRSSGPGGQSVNTTDSAVRITHLPTGIVVSQQDEKSQHKNKAKAMKILRARIYEAEREKKNMERAQDRKSKIGTGDRSERIRTYNFPQGRVTDHRINFTIHKLEKFLSGEVFDQMIENLSIQDQEMRLKSLNRNDY